MRSLRIAFGVVMVCAFAAGAWAKTPDGQPPSQETVCDVFSGAAFGLCNAYCEAMDCDSPNPHASPTACARVAANFERHTGMAPPCAVSPCDCPDEFARLTSGATPLAECLRLGDSTVLFAQDGAAVFVTIVPGGASGCGSGSSDFLPLTADQAAVCEARLRDAAGGQGIPCQVVGDE